MKKIILLILLSSLPFISNSQSIKGSVIAGLNSSQIDGDTFGGYNQIGLQLGISGEFPVGDNLFIEQQFLFSQLGSRSGQNLFLFSQRLNYMSLPTLFKYYYQEKISFSAGPCVDLLLNARKNQNAIKTDNSENFKRLNLAANIGVGYMLIEERLSVNAKFHYSILNISNVEFQANNALSLSLNYHL